MWGSGSWGKEVYQSGGGTQLYCKLLRSQVQGGLRISLWIWQWGVFLVTFIDKGGVTNMMGDKSLDDVGWRPARGEELETVNQQVWMMLLKSLAKKYGCRSGRIFGLFLLIWLLLRREIRGGAGNNQKENLMMQENFQCLFQSPFLPWVSRSHFLRSCLLTLHRADTGFGTPPTSTSVHSGVQGSGM